jgi:hypothetical protein
MTRPDFETRGLLCMSDGGTCGTDIASFAFSLGKDHSVQATRSTEQQLVDDVLFKQFSIMNLHRNEGKQCWICAERQAEPACLRNCLVCLPCLAISSMTALLFTCPCCRTRIRPELISNILVKRREITGLKGLIKDVCECSGCGEEKSLSNFDQIRIFNHKCWICDQCLLGIDYGAASSLKCPYCPDFFWQRELQELRNQQSRTRPPAPNYDFPPLIRSRSSTETPVLSSSGSREICGCGQTMDKGRVSCRNKCLCVQCLLKHYLISGDKNCRNCHTPLDGTFPPFVKCSECLKSFNFSEGHHIYGICEKGCLLCKYCIKIKDSFLLCPVCNSPAEGRPIAEVAREQARLNLACFCEDSSEPIEQLKCGDMVHYRCKNLLYSCRICGYFLKSKGENITLAKYL